MAPTPQKPASADSKLGIVILKLPKMDKSTLHLESSPSKITKTPSPKKRLSKTASPSRASPKPYLSLLPAGFRNCMGCHNKLPSHLFLAVNLISDSDYKEKCFRCRRVDAVQDCIKTYGEPPSGALPLAAQLDHLESQRDNGRKWQRKLDHRGFQVSDAYLDEVLEAVKKHDALQEAVCKIGASANAVFSPTFAMNDGVAATIPSRTVILFPNVFLLALVSHLPDPIQPASKLRYHVKIASQCRRARPSLAYPSVSSQRFRHLYQKCRRTEFHEGRPHHSDQHFQKARSEVPACKGPTSAILQLGP
ncbi:hypothetical protein FH972_026544 [Carpinus fangiana]|uniref:Uncharacterized protein n=1 Tax=Carpinus fangiana TaxID=176857 RepID=A0A5N6L4A2_9ROSI|nr:hypothetical protein FH972_026544 [Carpinus fangiana]